MKNRALFTLWVAVCAAVPALAAELEFSAGGDVEYDNNVFRSEHDTEDDVLFRLRPGVRVYEDRGDDLNFSAGYEAPVELSIDNPDDINDVDHIGYGRFNYHVNDRIEVFGEDRYGYLRSTLRTQDVDVANDFLRLNDQRDRVKVNDGSLGGLYRFSPRTVARAQASTSYFDSSREDRAQVWSVAGTADLNYALTVKHQLGVGGSYTFQDFGEREGIEGSQTNTYEVFGSWRWLIDPTLSFEVRGGPAYLTTNQDDADQLRRESLVDGVIWDGGELPGLFVNRNGVQVQNPVLNPGSVIAPQACPVIDGKRVASQSSCIYSVVLDSVNDAASVAGTLAQVDIFNPESEGESDETLTGFVNLTLTKQWLPTFYSGLQYSREQGDASGLGGTVIVDAVSLSNTWDFAERWSVSLRGDFVRRESAFKIAQTYDEVTLQPVPGGTVNVATRNGAAFNSKQDVDIDTNRYGVAFRITHRLFKTTSLYAQVRYDRQDSNSDTLGSDSDFENILATFGVRHVFEPITLW